MRLAIALVLVAGQAHADPADVEWTWWLGSGGGFARAPDEDDKFVVAFRLGAAVDFQLTTFDNPFHVGGDFELRWGPWLLAESRSDMRYVQAGLSIDLTQTRHADFGSYMLRSGAGINTDGEPMMSVMFLGGIRYAPGRRHEKPKVLFSSGGRIYGMLASDFEGRASLIVGFELEPTWALPPYSLRKLAGASGGF